MKPLRILSVNSLESGSSSLQRFLAMQRLGHRVTCIDIAPPPMSRIHHLMHRISCKLFRLGFDQFGPKDRDGKNTAIVKACKEGPWDVVYIEKGLTIEAATLEEVRRLQPKARIVGYSLDDMYARHNQSRPFLQSLPLYDVYFTTKSYGVEELKSLGAREVHFVGNAYDPFTHRPMAVDANARECFGGEVGFVGTFEAERHHSVEFLAAHGIPVRIWGSDWPLGKTCQGLRMEGRPLLGDDYALATCAFDINLGFLRKINRDLQTQRSVEIPACGAFMLAERTDEHQALFEEGKEAEYFDSNEELLAKVRYYLAHEDERKRIAAAGRQRCLASGYSYETRMATIMDIALR